MIICLCCLFYDEHLFFLSTLSYTYALGRVVTFSYLKNSILEFFFSFYKSFWRDDTSLSIIDRLVGIIEFSRDGDSEILNKLWASNRIFTVGRHNCLTNFYYQILKPMRSIMIYELMININYNSKTNF